jgi:hypothetical protein
MPSIKHLLRKLNAWICILQARLFRRLYTGSRTKASLRRSPKLVLLISRPQDIDLLIDVYKRSCKRDDISVSFWATERAVNRFHATRTQLDSYNIEVDFTLNHAKLWRAIGELRKIDALLTTVESTLAAHKVPYQLTRVAKAAGVRTYTLQHGFENVGLTYWDGMYGPHIRFAAQTVLTWGPVENIPPAVSEETRRKCVAVGCPKIHLVIPSERTTSSSDRPMIALFEGLHANRFDDRYITQFFKDLQDIVWRFSDLRFILKPHPGALVRSPLHVEFLASLRGVDVLDPAHPASVNWTTPRLLTEAVAIITTPSTIALDASLAKTPVAVIRCGQTIPYYENYKPLPFLDETEDWQDFLDNVLKDPNFMEPTRKAFLDRVMLPGDAANRILDLVVDNVYQIKKN